MRLKRIKPQRNQRNSETIEVLLGLIPMSANENAGVRDDEKLVSLFQ